MFGSRYFKLQPGSESDPVSNRRPCSAELIWFSHPRASKCNGVARRKPVWAKKNKPPEMDMLKVPYKSPRGVEVRKGSPDTDLTLHLFVSRRGEMKSTTAGADRAKTKGGQVPVGACRMLSI